MKSLMPQIDSNDGLFHNGNPATGEQGTRVTDTWLNNLQDRVRDVQAEAHYVLQKAGFTPKAETQTQLYQAIVKIIDDNRKAASLTQKGEVQLSSSTNSDSETQAATSKAVKTAYDKAVEAKTAADNAQRTADSKQSPATTLAGYGIGDLKIQSFAGDINTLKIDGIYAITQAGRSQNLPVSTSCHIQVIAGGDDSWCRQLAYVAYSTDMYERHQTSYQTDSWSAWVKIDGVDKLSKTDLVGEVAFFARQSPPSGWLKANGAAVSRTTYADLFAAIGTTFGAGDGQTTFNLPDLRGEFVRGLDDGRNVDGGRRLGAVQGDAIRNITGVFDTSKGSWAQQFVDFAEASGAFDLIKGNKQWTGDPNNGGNNLPTGFKFDASRVVPTANENRPRNIALLACIKY